MNYKDKKKHFEDFIELARKFDYPFITWEEY